MFKKNIRKIFIDYLKRDFIYKCILILLYIFFGISKILVSLFLLNFWGPQNNSLIYCF